MTTRSHSFMHCSLIIGVVAPALHLRGIDANFLTRRTVSSSKVLSGHCDFDHSKFDAVLRKFVSKKDTVVDGVTSALFDYEGVLASADALESLRGYVQSLKDFRPSCLKPDGKLAFWANAYNAFIIHLVLTDAQKSGGQLPSSIKDLHGRHLTVWNRQAGVVDGQPLTLEEVLDKARELKDPRIHAAVNCASLSCPDIRAGAYDAEGVQAQFDAQVRRWLRNPTKGTKRVHNGLLISPIFQWHADDFPDLASFLAGPLNLSSLSAKVVGYLPYNWELNAVPGPSPSLAMHSSSEAAPHDKI